MWLQSNPLPTCIHDCSASSTSRPGSTGYALGSRRSRLSAALERLTPRRSRRKSGLGSLEGTTHPQAGSLSSNGLTPGLAAAGTTPAGRRSPGLAAKLASSDVDGEEAPQAVPLEPTASSHTRQIPGAGTMLPPSPFDTAAAPLPRTPPLPAAAPGQQLSTAALPGNGGLLLYQRSMLRLRSSVINLRHGPALHTDALAAVEEGRLGEEIVSSLGSNGAEPELTLEPPRHQQGRSSAGSAAGAAGGPAAPGSGVWRGKAMRVTLRYQPLLTPSGCASGSQLPDPPLSPQAAADIYAGERVRVGGWCGRVGRPMAGLSSF